MLDIGDISTRKLVKIVMPIFGAAYAQHFYTDLDVYPQS